MKKLAYSLVAATLVMGAYAQGTAQQVQANAADRILGKISRVDIMNQILPLMLSKDQMKALLPVIEKTRETVRASQKKEADILAALEPKLDKAIKDAEEKGDVPTREFVNEAYKTLQAIGAARGLIADMNTALVLDAFTKNTNAGQRKVAANSLDPKLYGVDKKREEMPEEDRIRMFVREVLLHPTAYDVLRKLSIG